MSDDAITIGPAFDATEFKANVPTGQHARGVVKELLSAGCEFSCRPLSPDVIMDSAWEFSVALKDEPWLKLAMTENGLPPEGAVEW